MEEEFFKLIQDPDFCRNAEDESLLQEITLRKLGSLYNGYDAAKAKGDEEEMMRLQKEIDAKQAELKKLS